MLYITSAIYYHIFSTFIIEAGAKRQIIYCVYFYPELYERQYINNLLYTLFLLAQSELFIHLLIINYYGSITYFLTYLFVFAFTYLNNLCSLSFVYDNYVFFLLIACVCLVYEPMTLIYSPMMLNKNLFLSSHRSYIDKQVISIFCMYYDILPPNFASLRNRGVLSA